MYYDYHLKFDDEAQANGVLFNANGGPVYAAVDVIGIIEQSTGNMVDSEGFMVPERVAIDGWYANVRHTEIAPELEQYSIQVDNPIRVWA